MMKTTRRSFFQWAAGLLGGAAAAPTVAKAAMEPRLNIERLHGRRFKEPDDERLTAMQRALLESKAREIQVRGGRGCGKTYGLMRWMAQKVKDAEAGGYSLGATWIPSPNTFRGLMLVSSQMQRDMVRDWLVDAMNDLGVKATPEWKPRFGTVETKSGSMVSVRLYRNNPHMFSGHLFDAAVIDTDEPIDDNDYMTLLYALRYPVGRAITKVDYKNRTVTMSDIPEKMGQVAMTREAAPNRGAFGVSWDMETISSENLGFAIIYGPVGGSFLGKDTGLGNGRDGFSCYRTDDFTVNRSTPKTFIELADQNWLAHKRARSVQFP